MTAPLRRPASSRVPTWTARLVGEILVEALRWQRRHGGLAGPRGYARVGGLAFVPTVADHAREGWGLPEVAGEVEDEPRLHPLDAVSAERQRLFRRALEWQVEHLKDTTADAVILGAWLCAKVDGEPFPSVLRRHGVSFARGHAYRVRDRALGRIASALEWSREPLPGAD